MIYDLQKAGLWKRFAAWLFDGILTGILAVGIAFVLSLLLGYDGYIRQVEDAYDRYESRYGVSFAVTQEQYQSWSEEQRQNYDRAYEQLIADEQTVYAYNMVVSLTLMIASLGILLAMLILELAVPLVLKNGQTLGKKIFGLCVVRSDCVRMNTMQLFVRTVLGKYAVETMVPIYIVLMIFWGIMGLTGTLVLLVLLAAQIILLIATRKNQPIHDVLAGTAVADYFSQMIFNSTEELIEYQKKIHAERAARQAY